MIVRGKNPCESRFRKIAYKIEQMIIEGRIPVGNRLPAERQLAEILQASRSSVREALRVLEQKDLLEIRRGKKGGAYVTHPSHQKVSGKIDTLMNLDRQSLVHLAQFREAIEAESTMLTTNRANSDDLRILHSQLETVRSFRGKGRKTINEFIEAEKAVHLCITQIAGNPLFTEVLQAILNIKIYYHRSLGDDLSFMDASYQDLSGIVQAIENRESEIAVIKSREHISRFNHKSCDTNSKSG